MSLPIFTPAKTYIKKLPVLAFAAVYLTAEFAVAWNIDLSRRRKDMSRREASVVTEAPVQKPLEMISKIVPIEPKQEIVILNTENGFVPSTLRVKQGERYKVHVVNVNKEHKNISFVMDYFGQHHGTFYGNVKSFVLNTDKEGVYSFQCPETSFEGQMVVYKSGSPRNKMTQPGATPVGTKTLRGLASEAP